MINLEAIFSIILLILIYVGPKYLKYRSSNYKIASGNTFLNTIFDRGKYGEFLTFLYLEKLNGYFKLMTNLYLPKKDGTTTEIDLIMVAETGIYVFESKNYSGWIFGDERNKNWTQSLQNRKKNRFFNPIWQNRAHINVLSSVLGIDNPNLFKSYIIFSERCTLKKINVTSPYVKVMKRNALVHTVKKDINNSVKLVTPREIDQIYSNLQKYSCVDETIKRLHVSNIKEKS